MSQGNLHAKLIAVEAELMRRDFKEFVKSAWGIIDPAKLVWSWHVDAICEHLQAVTEGKINYLIINIPPGLAKSMLVASLWPAWYWTKDPSIQGLYASYDKMLATRDANRSRELIKSPWYQERFCQGWNIKDDVDGKTMYQTTAQGVRQIMSPGSGGTGFRGNLVVYDDPLRADDAHSATKRDGVIRWKTETMMNRQNDMANAKEVIIMQRLHDNDMSGYLLRAGGYQHLCLPMEFEPQRRCRTYTNDGALFWEDPRQTEGELLFPAKFPQPVVDKLKGPQGLGAYAYAGQYQQRPTPAGGGVFKREWFSNRFIEPPEMEEVSIFVDAGFKKTDDSDFVAVQVWGRAKNRAYFLDTDWRRMGFHETLASIRKMKERWPQVGGIFIEAAANGDAIIETLKMEFPGVVPLSKQGGKEIRIHASTKYYEAGDVYFPEYGRWVNAFIDEACAFNKGIRDDAIDCASHALSRLLMSSGLAWLEKMSRW